ncbi:hypothetical protein CLIB1444_11S00386 [[Candida] jaroonii]|uniref:Uncharacterized protein n=1 Tax=[Candida] jaroonii TaxID=467808 RepID=A0ACA9YD35_9ASCO|nr:hypothetical protein CLIB1444_11S00386 [[Candida] jaroonii]
MDEPVKPEVVETTTKTIAVKEESVENGIDSSSVTPTTNPVKRQKVSEEPKEEYESSEPVHEAVGGSSVRKYLNKTLTVHLLEGLKEVGKRKPEDPLKWLGEFLIERSKTQNNNQ